jgi:HTH-type transcriptional regulator / antitoxin HigA
MAFSDTKGASARIAGVKGADTMAPTREKMTRHTYEPDYAVPPGQTLQETIDAQGIDQRELAVRSGLSAKHINQVIKGVAPITHDTALRLERVTGIPARMWNNLEANYQEQRARVSEKERMENDLDWLSTIPTKELILRGVIDETTDKVSLLQAVLAFFGVASVEAWKEGWSKHRFAFRKSPTFKGKDGAMATWLRLGELEARKAECKPFGRVAFRAALDKIRSLTVKDPEVFVPRMIALCAACGVALVLVPEIRGAPVSGAAKWLTGNKAMICVNLRGKSNDRFWFTFFHEAGHILNDSKKETFIDVGYKDDPRELNANHFAASLLIPEVYEEGLQELLSYQSVEAFAEEIGIAPGIVVGRLQCEEIVPYSHLNKLKVWLDWK